MVFYAKDLTAKMSFFLGGCSVQSLWMVVAALFYAFYAVFVKYSGFEGIGSWEILFFRSIFGVVLFYGVMRFSGITLSTTHPWQHLIRSM